MKAVFPENSNSAICPCSGLTIITKAAWRDIPAGQGYTISFAVVGERILLSVPKGNLKGVDMLAVNEARKKVVVDHFGTVDPAIVEVRDLAHTSGVPSITTRQQLLQMLIEQKNCLGFITCNTGWIVRAIFLATIRLNIDKRTYAIEPCADYEAAIGKALNILATARFATTISSDEWQVSTKNIKVRYSIVGEQIVYTVAKGVLVAEDIPELLAAYEKVIQAPELLPGQFCRIADYRGVADSGWRGRFLLASGQEEVNNRCGRVPRMLVVFGLSPFMITALGVASKVLGYPVYFVKNEDEAIAKIHLVMQNGADRKQQLNANGLYDSDIDDALIFISSMIMGGDNASQLSDPSLDTTGHRLEPIFEALRLVRHDVNDLLNESRERNEEIVEKNRILQREIKRRQKIEGELLLALEGAEAATKAKGDFLATMSHEIRTPMNGLIGMLTLLKDTELDEQQQKMLAVSKSSANSLLTLINDILDFSKVDQGQLQLEVTAFDLKELLVSCCDLFSGQAKEQGLQLNLFFEIDLAHKVIGDPGKLRQILTNLLSNAVKFTSAGSVLVQVDAVKKGPELVIVQIQVIDEGIGIAAEKREKIFEVFSQADSSTTRQYGGTGLGLSICQRLAEFMEGNIQVDSVLGAGATFTLTLPFGLGDLLTTPDTIEGKEEVDVTISPGDIHILVVEDEPVNQLFIESLLENFGFKSTHAGHGLQAVEFLKGNNVDLVLMDCQMPVMDGYEATREIRQLSSAMSKVKIVALTAHAMAGDRERCLDCGMDEYITKPIDPEFLHRTILRLVAEPRA